MNTLQEKIIEIKEQKNALLIVHNYQVPEIQEIADFLGDSLELCRKVQAAEDVDMIVFCGVDFMAETAKVLNQDKRVVIPSGKAICPMAGMLSMDVLLEARAQIRSSSSLGLNRLSLDQVRIWTTLFRRVYRVLS
jgi:quinolinate synthase